MVNIIFKETGAIEKYGSGIQPAMEQGLVAMKFADSPNHPHQRYYLKELSQKDLSKNKNNTRIKEENL